MNNKNNTMKDYFSKLLNYDRYQNGVMLQAIKSAGSPERAVQLMAHLLGSQQVWLTRCKKEQGAIGGAIWPDWKVEELESIMDQNYQNWQAHIDGLTDGNFSEVILYKDSKGNPHQNILVDILAHVFNHGTHHRAQVGQLLKQAGLETLPVTDYIFYIRNQSK